MNMSSKPSAAEPIKEAAEEKESPPPAAAASAQAVATTAANSSPSAAEPRKEAAEEKESPPPAAPASFAASSTNDQQEESSSNAAGKSDSSDDCANSSTGQTAKTVPGSIEEISENTDGSLPFPRHEDLEAAAAAKVAKEDEKKPPAKNRSAVHKVGAVPLPPESVREDNLDSANLVLVRTDSSSAPRRRLSQASSSNDALAISIAEGIEYLRSTTVSSMGFTDIVDADETDASPQVAVDSRRSTLTSSMDDTALTPAPTALTQETSTIVPEAYLVTPEDEEAFMMRLSSIRGELIQEPEPEVVEAKPLDFCHRHSRSVALFSVLIVVGFGSFVAVAFSKGFWGNAGQVPTEMPSGFPSAAPSFDPRPTLEIVRERGVLRCGMRDYQVEGTFRYRLCQAIAAVTLNNPDAVEIVESTGATRFVLLNDRAVDVLSGGETYTIERCSNEPTTGSSFVFSAPYYYDGMVFAGDEAFVSCAQDQKRYDECSELVICVIVGTTDQGFVNDQFTSDFIVVTANVGESLEFYLNGTCNVVANGRLGLLNFQQTSADLFDSEFVVGSKTFNNDPLAFVTRNNDPEWSNIVNWVLQALFYGERQGITKSETDCQRTMDSLTADWAGLNFLNAVYCLGNYGEIYDSSQYSKYGRTPINTINNGTAMIQVIPYGDLDNAKEGMFSSFSETYATIKDRKSLKCGLLVQDGYSEDDITASEGLFGMSMNFCQTLAASMFNGKLDAVEYAPFQNAKGSLAALNSAEVDVLLGVPANKDWSLGNETFNGVTFSRPYFYGNETGMEDVSFYPVMTREYDTMFSSFVNCIVLCTFAAAKDRVGKDNPFVMPMIYLYGEDMQWSLKDAISASGNYDEIYFNNFDAEESRGRNALNGGQPQPQLLDMPGLVSSLFV